MIRHATLRVQVDARRCEGHGLCLQLAPEVFDISGDEIAFCTEHLGLEHLDAIKAAFAACPRQAISFVEDHHDR